MQSTRKYRAAGLAPLGAALVAATTLFCPLVLHAATNTGTDLFHVGLSEKEMRLASDSVAMIQSLQNDLGFQRMIARNTPYVEVQNDATSSDPITQFTLTIGDSRFHFADLFLGGYTKLGTTTPNVAMTSSVEQGGDKLVVNFTDGLQPGDIVRFRVDIDVDPAYLSDVGTEFPDYRTVMFDMTPLGNLYGPDPNPLDSNEDNSMVEVAFGTGGNLTPPVAFTDSSTVPAVVNTYVRCCAPQDVIDNPARLTGGTVIPQVPEPATAVLGLLGLLGGVALRRRYRPRG